MQIVNEKDIVELLEEGNGSTKFISAADGQMYHLSYLWGKFRIDRLVDDATIPLSARRGRGRAIAAPPTD